MKTTSEHEASLAPVCTCWRASPLRLRRPNDVWKVPRPDFPLKSRSDFPSNHMPSTVPFATFLKLLCDLESFVKNPQLPIFASHLKFNKSFASFDFEKLPGDCCPQRIIEIIGIGALVTSPSTMRPPLFQVILT